jgi:hypothetical protein
MNDEFENLGSWTKLDNSIASIVYYTRIFATTVLQLKSLVSRSLA